VNGCFYITVRLNPTTAVVCFKPLYDDYQKMAKQTFILSAPDRPGTLRRAAVAVAAHHGNIVRLSYNKAVDVRTVFLDVEAEPADLQALSGELADMGYLASERPASVVVTVSLSMADRPGELLRLLDLIEQYDLGVSYINSVRSDGARQEFSIGLLFDRETSVDEVAAALRGRYGAVVTGRNTSDNTFDNSVFYQQFAAEVRTDLGLSEEQSMEFLSEANRVLQFLQRHGENPYKVFGSIRTFCRFISSHRGEAFTCKVTRLDLAPDLEAAVLAPVCGSNVALLRCGDTVTVIDTGYAVYHEELLARIRQVLPAWDRLKKRLVVTHADIDHCGLLYHLQDKAEIWMNRKTAEGLARQAAGEDDYREEKEFCHGYSKLSRIITGYRPPDLSRVYLLDKGEPVPQDGFTKVGTFAVGPYVFTVLEGNGGHMYGECLFVCRELNLLFTGDLLLDLKHFPEELREFNSIAPYLMTTVDIDPPKARAERGLVTELMHCLSRENGKPCTAVGGHGPVFRLRESLEPAADGVPLR